ncbi:MAG: TetR/AcrR family transcriptional regulator [Pseudomonadota bacterium]|jgi:AcrR family transcriptional regulator
MAKRPPSPVAAPVAESAAERQARRRERQRTVADVRRALMLDAARAAFFELGLEGTSMREIAKRAGYTPGAIYSYFTSKEEIYGALLGESLERLNAAVAAAVAGTAGEQCLRAGALAFYGFYREQPRDLDLGFYLFRGMQPRGLTPELNRRLNTRLRDALSPCEEALRQLGMGEADAVAETTALFAHIVGLLVLSHTGRIRMFRQSTHALFARYLDALVARARPPVL